ncbi:MAG: permease [Bacteroidetes bacterium]|jgi:drug/metabolite transporter (DMT)-like permease|nr:permease [Bacteroidota bacterium]
MSKNVLSWFLLILLSLIWGSSFILMKRGMEVFSSEQVAALRIGIAFLFLLPLMVKHYKINLRKYWKGLLLMGCFGNLFPAFLFTKAETGITSSLAGMLNALTPLFAIMVGVALFRMKTGRNQVTGVLIGFAGALMLVLFDDNAKEGSNNIWYALMVALATFCYAISVNSIKKFLSDVNSITATVWSFTFIGLIAFIAPFVIDIFLPAQSQTHLWPDVFYRLSNTPGAWTALMYISILAILGSAISVILFNILIKLSNPVFAASCTYLIPVVAVFWGLFDHENIVWQQLVAIVVILTGVWLINKKKQSSPVPTE